MWCNIPRSFQYALYHIESLLQISHNHSHMFLLTHIVPQPAKEFEFPRRRYTSFGHATIGREYISGVIFPGRHAIDRAAAQENYTTNPFSPPIAWRPEKTTLEMYSLRRRQFLELV